jgi:hypothetical protein
MQGMTNFIFPNLLKGRDTSNVLYVSSLDTDHGNLRYFLVKSVAVCGGGEKCRQKGCTF